MTKTIAKLVRDKIPEELTMRGIKFRTLELNEKNTLQELYGKLQEECSEFLENYNTLALVDILEVVYAIGKRHGITKEKLEEMRQNKAGQSGAFDNGIFLIMEK